MHALIAVPFGVTVVWLLWPSVDGAVMLLEALLDRLVPLDRRLTPDELRSYQWTRRRRPA